MTAAPPDHLRDRPLGDVEEPGQIHCGDCEVVIKCLIRKRLAYVDPRVVDESVDPADPIERSVENTLCGFGFGDVTLDAEIVPLVGGRH